MSGFSAAGGLEAELAGSAEMADGLKQIADEVLARAQALAEPHKETGEYYDSLHVEVEGGEARVVAGTGHWSEVEFGTSVMPAQAVLRGALGGGG